MNLVLHLLFDVGTLHQSGGHLPMMAGDQRILTEKNMGESDLFWKILVFFFLGYLAAEYGEQFLLYCNMQFQNL